MRLASWLRAERHGAAWNPAWPVIVLCTCLCVADDAPTFPAMASHPGIHYVIESDADQTLVATLSGDLECLYAFLTTQFAGHLPPSLATAMLKVRFFSKRDDFLAYAHATCPGFNPGWSGYYRYGLTGTIGEVVAYDLGSNHAVLYHEAFHQYLNRAFPGIRAWPQWFNEGLADLIGRGHPVRGVFTLTDSVNNQDFGLVRSAMESGTQVPLAQLVTLDITGWNGERMTLDYAEGYLLAWFLMRSNEPRRRELLPSFLSALSRRQDYAAAYSATIETYGMTTLQREFNAFMRGQP